MRPSKPPRATILAVGTELTTGQIINRNAAWISARLSDLGIEVVLHETVADDREMIRSALEHCGGISDLMFITGGLGPTSDDFTREVVADWAGRELDFHEPSWTKITQRLGGLGIHVAESNRQQCYFPKGADVIPNAEGTADAFIFDRGPKRVWVLPGPPREIDSVWKQTIDGDLKRRFPPERLLSLFTWQCLGKSEAELGEVVEAALQGSGLQTGYRAHIPFVEVKVWCPEAEVSVMKPWFDKLEAEIAPWLFSRQGEDMGARLLDLLTDEDALEIFDAATAGMLTDRLGRLLRQPERAEQASSVTLVTEWSSPYSSEEWVRLTLDQADPETVTLALAGFTPEGQWTLGLKSAHIVMVETLQSPWQHSRLVDRSRALAVELSLKRWSEWLTERLH